MKCFKCSSKRVIDITAKCKDNCDAYQHHNQAKSEGYSILGNNGDYVEFSFCLECGQMQATFPMQDLIIKRCQYDIDVKDCEEYEDCDLYKECQLENNMWKEQIVAHGIDDVVNGIQTFNMNDWGSCQYSSALGMFRLIEKMKEHSTFEAVLEILGVKLSFNTIRTFDEVKAELIKDTKRFITEATDKMDKTYQQERLQLTEDAVIAEDLFRSLRKSAWDLWSAAPTITNLFFPNLSLKGVSPAPGKGPIVNVEVQSNNYTVGIMCALLVEQKIIKDEAAFSNFDT